VRRRLFNLVTLLSLLLSLASAALWVRSYRVPEQWSTASPLVGKQVAGLVGPWERRRQIGSSRGRLIVYDSDLPGAANFPGAPPRRPPGYQWGTWLGELTADGIARGPYVSAAKGTRLLKLPGVRFASVPAQVVPAPSPPVPVPGQPGTHFGDVTVMGRRILDVSLWLPTLAAAVLPVLWAWRWRVSAKRARRIAQCRCLRCGYDLRASPGRCPECGELSEARRQEIEVSRTGDAADSRRT
jgi:hypothetical protein